jgi:phosphate uptake regulator
MTPRVAFQEALGTLRADVDWLGALAEEAVRGAVGALVGDDGTKAELVIAGDDDLDRLFVALEERAYRIFWLGVSRTSKVSVSYPGATISIRYAPGASLIPWNGPS